MAVSFRVVRHWPSQMLIVAAALIFIGTEVALAYRHISDDKTQTIEAAYADSEAVVLALTAHVDSVFQSADSALQRVADDLTARGGLRHIDPATLHELLALHARGSTLLRAVLVVGPDGAAYASSNNTHQSVPSLYGREAMRIHRGPDAPREMHIAGPVEGAGGIWILPMSRSVRRADGALEAVLVATLNLDGLRTLYDALSMRDNGTTLGLVRGNGQQLVRIPFSSEVMRSAQPGGIRIAELMIEKPQGRLQAVSGVDGTKRLYAYHRLGRYPVAAYAGRSESDALAPWRARMNERLRALIGLAMLLLVFAAVAAIKVGRLSRSEERLERASHAAAAGVWELDLQSGRMWRSKQWTRLLGYAPAEVPCTLDGFFSVIHPDDALCVRLTIERLRAAEDPVRVEYRVRRKDGRYMWVECTAYAFRRRADLLTYAVGSMRDITKRKDVELSLRDNARLLNLAQRAADAGVWSVDFRTGITRWSEGCYRLYGVNPVVAPPGPTNWQYLVYEPDRCRVAKVVQDSIERHAEFSIEFRVELPGRGIRWLWTLGSAVPDEDGELLQMAGITLDITERKKGEEVRQALLASERAARAEAERASRAKEEFLATVSHELRTPLNSILGWAHVLRTRDKDPELVARSIESIERSALAQAQLIADLLDVSRIEAGTLRLDLEAVALQPILEAAVSTVIPAAEAKGVWLICEPTAANVRGDPARLEQVMWNLLSNAVKFTPKGGAVNLTTKVVDGEAVIEVSDTGVGIPLDFVPRLFKRFSQSERTTRQPLGGLGLGLAIIKHLVEAHGGSIDINSEGEGKGTTATVRLPLAEAQLQGEPPRMLTKTPVTLLNGISVLLVEDDVDSREVATLILSGHGAHLKTAASVDLACQQLLTFVPHVIVADLSMPEKDGFALIRTVRENPRLRTVPALALSALASAEDRARALASGFDAHLAKPVEPQVLLEAVAALAARGNADETTCPQSRRLDDSVSTSKSER